MQAAVEVARGDDVAFFGDHLACWAFLTLGAQQPDVLKAYSGVNLAFALPLALIVMMASLRRGSRSP